MVGPFIVSVIPAQAGIQSTMEQFSNGAIVSWLVFTMGEIPQIVITDRGGIYVFSISKLLPALIYQGILSKMFALPAVAPIYRCEGGRSRRFAKVGF